MRLCCLFGFAAGVDLLLNIPDLTTFNSLVDDALSLFGVELGVVASTLGGVSPLLRGHRTLSLADVLGHKTLEN